MAIKLFVGGLDYAIDNAKLEDLFKQFGTVVSAQVIVDRFSNQSKGFGFVEMSTEEESQNAIKELNGKDFEGRSLLVNEARPREDRPTRNFGGGGGGSRNNYGGGRSGGGGSKRY